MGCPPNQTTPFGSDLSLHCLPRPISGKFRIFTVIHYQPMSMLIRKCNGIMTVCIQYVFTLAFIVEAFVLILQYSML